MTTFEDAQATAPVPPDPFMHNLVGDRPARRELDVGEPILPQWLRDRSQFFGMVAWWAQQEGYRLRKWSWNLPLAVVLLACYSPRGFARLAAKVYEFIWDRDTARLRHEHAENIESPDYRSVNAQRFKNIQANLIVAGTVTLPVLVPVMSWTYPRVLSAVVAFVVGIWIVKVIPRRSITEIITATTVGWLIYQYLPLLLVQIPRPPAWAAWATLAAVDLGLGWYGRPRSKPLVPGLAYADDSRAHKPSRDELVMALCRIGVPGMTPERYEQVDNETRLLGMGVSTTPHGYVAELELPPGHTVDEVVKRRGPLAGAFRRDLGCVWPGGNPDKHPGYLRIFLSHKSMTKARQPVWPLMAGRPIDSFDPIPLFTDEEMRWVALKLDGTHMAVGGASGSGKSVFLRQLACALSLDPRDRLIVFDGKRSGDLECVRRLAHGFYEGAEQEDAEGQLQALRDLVKERERRARYLKELPHDIRSPKVTSALVDRYAHLSQTTLIIDECQEYTEYGIKGNKEDKAIRDEFIALLTKLSRLGRAAGIRIVFASQRPDASVLPTAIMGNCGIRIAFRVTEQVHNDQILGTSARKNGIDATMFTLRDAGLAWIRGGDQVDAQVVRTWSPMCDLATADEIAAKAYQLRADRGLLTGMAAGETPEPREQVDIVDDCRELVETQNYGRNSSLQWLVERLQLMRPSVWRQLDVDALGSMLRNHQPPITPASIRCPVEGRPMQGVKYEWLNFERAEDDEG
jgi:S-DNA-T family DNA segregation ATPase FtsK/SpoIIIE